MNKRMRSKLCAILMMTGLLLLVASGCIRTHTYGGGVYTGEWKDDKPNGYGKFVYSQDVIYEGEWKDGKLHGQGIATGYEGTRFEGEWKYGKLDGYGTKSDNGNTYVGEFKEGMMHGKGTLTMADGTSYVGTFVKDQYVGP